MSAEPELADANDFEAAAMQSTAVVDTTIVEAYHLSMSPDVLAPDLRARRPTEAPEHQAVVDIMRTAMALEAPFERLFRQHGLTAPQYNVLRILRAEGRRMPSLSIAEQMVTRVPDITRLVDRLEAAHWVQRERSTEDRRVVYVSITPQGLELLARLDEPVESLHENLLEHLTRKEIAELTRLLGKARQGS